MLGESKYWNVNVVITTVDENGKEKKSKEEHLVWARDLNDIQDKVKDEMSYCPNEWTIGQVKESKITSIYGKKTDE